MAIRQYIGARYMPKFMGTYDVTTAYEALSVVDNGMGTSYVSNKPTPAGTPLTDTEYWSIYGASSGAIIDLQNRMTAVETDIDTSKKRALFIGNSYLSYEGIGLYYSTEDMFDERYYKASSGAGFLTYTDHSVTYKDLLEDAAADTNIPADKITDIIFISAIGDDRALCERSYSNFKNDFETQIQLIMNEVYSLFPNAKRVSCSLGTSRNQHNFTDMFYRAPFELNLSFEKILPKYGMIYDGWIGWAIFMEDGMFKSDHYHPSADGVEKLTAKFKEAYRGGIVYEPKATLGASITFDYPNTNTASVDAVITPYDWELYFNITEWTAGTIPGSNCYISLDSIKYMPADVFNQPFVDRTKEFIASVSSGVPVDKFYCMLTINTNNHATNITLAPFNSGVTFVSNNRNGFRYYNKLSCPY